MEPIFLRRALWTASSLPEFLGEDCDVIVSECGDSPSNRSRLSLLMSFLGVLEGLPCMLLSSQVILFSLLLGSNTMGMRGNVV